MQHPYFFQTLQETDEELRNNFSDILTRFYLAFESIHKYVTDLNFYIDELGDGVYIHQSVDSIMFNEEGKQLMVHLSIYKCAFSNLLGRDIGCLGQWNFCSAKLYTCMVSCYCWSIIILKDEYVKDYLCPTIDTMPSGLPRQEWMTFVCCSVQQDIWGHCPKDQLIIRKNISSM